MPTAAMAMPGGGRGGPRQRRPLGRDPARREHSGKRDRVLHRDEADEIGGERRRLGADDALGKRVAVEQARRGKQRRERQRRQRAARQDEPGKRQDRERDRDLGAGQVDAGKVQARADGARGKEGERHQRGGRERRSRAAPQGARPRP